MVSGGSATNGASPSSFDDIPGVKMPEKKYYIQYAASKVHQRMTTFSIGGCYVLSTTI